MLLLVNRSMQEPRFAKRPMLYGGYFRRPPDDRAQRALDPRVAEAETVEDRLDWQHLLPAQHQLLGKVAKRKA